MSGKPVNRRVQFTKNALREAMIELITEKPLTSITVKDVCARADINRSTFYLHYNDIYDMLDTIENTLIIHLENIFLKYDNINAENFPYPVFHDIFQLIDSSSDLILALIGPNGDISFIMKIRELFHHKCIENWLSSHTPKLLANYDYFSNFLVYGCVGLIENWIVTGKKETPEEISALVTKLVSTGVTSLL